MKLFNYSNRSFLTLLLLVCSLSIFACEDYNQEKFEEEVFIESYLIAGSTLPEVKVSKTSPIYSYYDFEELGFDNAIVKIFELDGAGSVTQTFSYSQVSKGVYEADNTTYTVQPSKSYRLEVITTMGVTTSESTVPPTFGLVETENDTVMYQGEDQFSVYFAANEDEFVPFIFNILAQDTLPENLTPFYLFDLDENEDGVFDENDDPEDDSIEDYYLTSSGIINQANYDVIDGKVRVRLPWISIAFYGRNKIAINKIDENLYDFIRSQSVQTGDGLVSPGEIQKIIFNVDGGIGVFGAITADTSDAFITRPF